ncbi:hypothetical protein [Pseudomonas oryzihabitans]|uniref:hypothetical protein n=1 Tax=Pseudomonas oryzihabitans TaxID=47885 RepID=UPI003EC02930
MALLLMLEQLGSLQDAQILDRLDFRSPAANGYPLAAASIFFGEVAFEMDVPQLT